MCEAKYYEDKTGNCTVCPDDMDCNKEGATIATVDLKGGSWRPNNKTDEIYSCPVPKSCVGGNSTTQYCANGSTGILCAICEPGWFRRGSLSLCQKCPANVQDSMAWTAALVAGLVVTMAVVIGIDLKYRCSQARGGGQLKPLLNAVQQITVMILFPVEVSFAHHTMGSRLLHV